MTMESKIIAGVKAGLEAVTDIPVFEFGSRSDESTGVQIVVQCDRPAVAQADKSGRAAEWTFSLVLHSILHSQLQREDETKKGETIKICENYIRGLALSDINDWLDGDAECTGINEQDGVYTFSENFDDFATVAEIHAIATA